MKLVCLSQDNVLYSKLKGVSLFQKVSLLSDFSQLNEFMECDVMILSDRIVSFEMLSELRQSMPYLSMFFMVSDSSDYRRFQKVETMCHAHDIYIVYPKQTQDQIISFIKGVLKPGEDIQKNQVVTFVGAQSKVGLTSTVLAAATRLGMTTDAKIGVLGLNSWNPGTVFLKNYSGIYLDEIKTLLSNKMLASSQLMKDMYQHNHFFYLAGNRDIKKRLHYSIKDIHYLIEQAKKIYDMVLIDAGCNFDDALCIQGLLNTDSKFLVTNQQLSGLEAWNTAFEQVLEPVGFIKSDFLMIVNQYKRQPQFPDIKQLAHDYGVPCLRHIVHVGDLGLIVEANQNLIVEYDEPEYITDIDFIAKALVKTYRLRVKEQTPVKRLGFMQKIFS
ncbi:MAG: P-loop NTPase family protein [Eubacteriales bacterium]